MSPFETLTGRKMKIGLSDSSITSQSPRTVHSRIAENDYISKCKTASYADATRHTRPSNLQPGDYVLVRQKKANILSTPYSPSSYVITRKKDTMITAEWKSSGKDWMAGVTC